MTVPQPLLAIDAPSVLFRAYYALPSSIKGSGERPVNALLGSVNIVLREILAHTPRIAPFLYKLELDHKVCILATYIAPKYIIIGIFEVFLKFIVSSFLTHNATIVILS